MADRYANLYPKRDKGRTGGGYFTDQQLKGSLRDHLIHTFAFVLDK